MKQIELDQQSGGFFSNTNWWMIEVKQGNSKSEPEIYSSRETPKGIGATYLDGLALVMDYLHTHPDELICTNREEIDENLELILNAHNHRVSLKLKGELFMDDSSFVSAILNYN